MRAMRERPSPISHFYLHLQFKWVVGVAKDSFQPQNARNIFENMQKTPQRFAQYIF